MSYHYVSKNVIEYRGPHGTIRRACALHVFVVVPSNPKRERCTECKFERDVEGDA